MPNYTVQFSKCDLYPMPRIAEVVGRIGDTKYITTLDLAKGYWKIPLDPVSREIKVFAIL